MTVPTTADSVSYVGPQDATLAFTFRIFQDADLLVTETALDGTVSTLVLDDDYTVSGVLSYSGGTITLLDGNLGSGVGLNIARAPESVQDTSLQSQGAYDAKVVENALDLLTMICQYLQNQLDRALVVPPGTTPVTLPDPLALALLQWNAGATGLQNIAIADLGNLLAAGNYVVDTPTFTAGTTTVLTLSVAPGTVNNTAVYFDGVYQQKATYSLSGLTITLSSAVPYGVLAVEVVQAGVLPINTPANNSASTATYQNLSVTGPKIADATIEARSLIAATLTQNLLAANVLQAGKNGIINGSAIIANGADYVASVSGTYGYGKSELCKGALVGGGGVSGTLTQVTNSSAGVTGCAFRWSNVSVSGTGRSVKYRFYIEAKDAIRYKNKTITVSGKALTAETNTTYTISISKANSADNFSAVTLISAGSGQLATPSVELSLYSRAVAMGDCSNGIQIDIVAATTSLTVVGVNYDLTDLQFEPGSTETAIEIRPVATESQNVLWMYENLVLTASDVVGMAQCTTTAAAVLVLYYGKKRTVPTVTITAPTALQVALASGVAEPVISHAVAASTLTRDACQITLAVAATPLVAGNASAVSAASSAPSIAIDARF